MLFRLGEREMPFTTNAFLTSFSIPNFYFHSATTYDVLRIHGVPLGKMDFLGALKVGAKVSDVLQLWTAATPNGWKVSIMLEELIEAGVQLPEREVITVDIMSGDQFSEAFTAVSPNQKIPGLVHGSVRMMESCAILQYLGAVPESLVPDGGSAV